MRSDLDNPAVPGDCESTLEAYTAPTTLPLSYPRPSHPSGTNCELLTTLVETLGEYGEFCLQQYRTGHFQTFMVEARMHGTTIFRPIFDDSTQAGSQEVSLPIRKEIYNILGCKTVTEVRRSGATCHLQDVEVRVRQPAIEVSHSLKKRRSHLCSVLQCNRSAIDRLKLPDEWQLPVISAVFWKKEARLSDRDVKALVACFVACHNWSSCLDCPPPTTRTPELLRVVHYLAQWQCIYFDALALNQLLDMPFQRTTVAKLFDAKLAVSYALESRSIEGTLRNQGCDISLYRNLLDAIDTNLAAEARSSLQPITVAAVPTQNRYSLLKEVND